jgi:DNA-binding NarL/FixJ family response regulator
VLSLIAAGHAPREVAEQLCYSEQTVKNVLHDVVTKLNERSARRPWPLRCAKA